MEEVFKAIASRIALGIELAAALMIAYGALEALYSLIFGKHPLRDSRAFAKRRAIFLRFGVWLLLGLEFELAADIIRTAISPSWTDIGQLGAIALIRTFLNFFLERDIQDLAAEETAGQTG